MSHTQIAQGKTKVILLDSNYPNKVIIRSTDNITAGDGVRRDTMLGKAVLSTATTSAVFRLLNQAGIPTHFIGDVSDDPASFLAHNCRMVPLEVVIRRNCPKGSSYGKRHPAFANGGTFPVLVTELFHKDDPQHDPLVVRRGDKWYRLPAKEPADTAKPLDDIDPLFNNEEIALVEEMARRVFLILEGAWQRVGGTLHDLKIEFGRQVSDGQLVVADVIDSDSWRVTDRNGQRISKQPFREGASVGEVAEGFRIAAGMVNTFPYLPRQQIVLWQGSSSDNALGILDVASHSWRKRLSQMGIDISITTLSAHKHMRSGGYNLLDRFEFGGIQTVVIALVGKSNGLGPTIAGSSTLPVISVPNTYREFPDDVWSSLRTPSDTPSSTILDPHNAILAAVQILAGNNPLAYAWLREHWEKEHSELAEPWEQAYTFTR